MQTETVAIRRAYANPRLPLQAEAAYRIVLGTLLIWSLALRLFGTGWGIPDYNQERMAGSAYRNSYHLDEDNYLWGLVQMRPAEGNYDVRDYHWGTLQHYLIYGVLLLSESVGVIPAPWEDYFTRGDAAVLPRLYLLGRFVSVIAGAVGTLVVASLGRLLGGRAAGLGAAVAYSIAPLAVVEAHYLTGDVVMSVLVVAFLQTAVMALQRHSLRLLIISGFLLGLAAADKYSAAFALPALFVAQIGFGYFSISGERSRFSPAVFLLPLVGVACGFMVGEPFAVIAPGEVLEGFRQAGQGNALLSLWDIGLMRYLLVWHATNVAKFGLTWPLFLLGVGGMAYLLVSVARQAADLRLRHRPNGLTLPPFLPSLVVLAGVFGLGLSLILNRVPMLRNDQPLVALLAVGSGLAWSRLPGLWLRALVGAVAVVVAGVITLGQLSLMSVPHTANRLLAWLNTNVKPGQLVAQAWPEYPPLDGGSVRLFRIDPWRPAVPTNLRPDYIIIDDMTFNPPEQSLRDLLSRDYNAVVTFEARPQIGPFSWDEGVTPHDWKYSHPTFTVYTPK